MVTLGCFVEDELMLTGIEPSSTPSPADIVALIEAVDWDGSPIGPRSTWPQSLQTSLSIMVNSGFPMVVMWGRELLLFYNAGYVPVLGEKHPWAMGRPMHQVWPEIWDTIGPMLHGVLQTGTATYDEDLLLPLRRSGFLEECYFTFSYSPIGERGGGIGGVFCAVAETSRKVIAERRLRTVHELETKAFGVRNVDQVCRVAIDVLGKNQIDVPFARIYLFDKNDRLRLVEASGPAAGADESWPVESVARLRSTQVVASPIEATARLIERVKVNTAIVLPLAAAGEDSALGAMVMGLSPFSALDDEYRRFLDLVTAQIAASINGARAYQEAQSRAETLAELDRAKTVFFSNISHEFRTPLTLLLGPIENVLRDQGDELEAGSRGELLIARRNAYRLLKLVNHLLEFSRIESNRVDASFEAVDVVEFVTDVASGFRSAIEQAGLVLEIDVPQPITAYVDRRMFERILLNLLSNAVKFTFQGRISVRVWRDLESVYVSVRDSGTGIAAEDLPKLFERFNRVRGARSRTDEGTGIGLALVSELVRLHGGSVAAESKVGEGSTFTVSMPLGKGHLPAEHIVATTPDGAVSQRRLIQYAQEVEGWLGMGEIEAEPQSSGERILVVDDNSDLRAYLKRMLSKRWNVEVVNDGAAALERISAEKPDLIVSDIMMPGIDGIELLRCVRSNSETERIPFIFLSARAGEQASIEGFLRGADDYIVKPFSEEKLTARVEAVLKVAKIREEATTSAELARDVAMKSEKFLRMLADTIPQMVWTAEPAGRVDYFNRRFYEFTGMTESEALAGDRWMSAFQPEDVEKLRGAWQTAIATGEDFSFEARVRAKDGKYRWFLAQGVALKATDGAVVRWFAAATDINDQKLLEERQRFLAHASNVLASSLDVGAILQKITELCVPALADWCQLQVISSDDRLRVEAVNHCDPTQKEELERLLGREVVTRAATTGSPQVLRSATARRLDEHECRRAVRDNVAHAADRRIYENAGLGNAIIVPLVARGQALGTLHLVNMEGAKVHSEFAIAIAEELARRAALAIDNSRLYEREHRVATALQQAMLPTHLPNVAQVEFGSVYRPAERESQVGGDWYDAFVVAGDKVAVSIGDVGGHGLGAAVAMSEARQALRVSALEGLPPSEVLRRANSAVSLNDKAPIITAIFGTIDPARGKFTFSSAGHPPAILAPISQDAYYLPGGGIPLGTSSDASFPNLEIDFEPYSTLLLYTDGLIEFSRDIAKESQRLLDAMNGRVSDMNANGAQAIVDYMLTGRQMDDIAVLVATFLPDKALPLDISLTADLHASAITRRLAGRFARAARLSQDRTSNLTLAVGEAVANAIEHAYGGRKGRLRLRLSKAEESVVGEVYDEGRWRYSAPAADRGRGLTILHSVTKRLHLQSTARGTTLTFEV
jgi:PAS domain S-box-containing protein